MGTACFRQGNIEMAIREWQEVLALVPNFVRAHYNLGLAYERLGQRDRAITSLQVALKIVQNMNDSTGERRIQQELERLQGADDYLRQVRLDPTNQDARFNLAQVYQRQGKLEIAIEEYSKLLESSPNSVEAHFQMGVCLGKLGKTDQAIEMFRRVIELEPEHAASNYHLGLYLSQTNELDEAVQFLHRAVQRSPDESYYHYNLGRAYAHLGDS